jgi:phosphoserine phosphatase
MSRWEDVDPRRLRPQEQALLALCDRLTVLEQAFTAEVDAHQMTRKRLDHLQEAYQAQIVSLRGEVAQLRGETRSILRILERET